MKNKKVAKKKNGIEMTLWDVILSYPDLHDPKPFKGNTYYSTDILFEEGHPDLKKLQKALKEVCTEAFGSDDRSEWPENAPSIKDGNDREDSKGYADRKYIKVSTKTDLGPIPVVGPTGKPFNPQMVKGGMFANVAIKISEWEFDGDNGVSIYLQGVQIDTDKPGLNFGGGRSVKQMFSKDDAADESDEDEKPKSKKKAPVKEEAEEELDFDYSDESDED